MPSSLREIASEVIWNNKFLYIDKKCVYRRDIEDLRRFFKNVITVND